VKFTDFPQIYVTERGVLKVEKQTQDFFFWNAGQSKKICLREIFSVEQFSEEELRRGLEPAVA
jgi:hypothetical protein